MHDSNRLWKWVLIVVLTALAVLVLYPPQDKLKPGIDLAGGTSLIYEIDDTGMTQGEKSGLADRLISVLRKRVDPNNQFNIIWRPIGNNRIEIQMPRPPKEAAERRAKFEEEREVIRQKNVTRTDIEKALALDGEARDQALAELVRGVESRKVLLDQVVTAKSSYDDARGQSNFEAEDAAYQNYVDAIERVVATNLTVGRLGDVLALSGDAREGEVKRLKADYPAYASSIDATVDAYDQWIDKRGSLEDPSDLKRLLRGAGVLEFRILAEKDPATGTLKDPKASLQQDVATYIDQLQKRGPRPKAGDRYAWYPVEDIEGFMQLRPREQLENKLASTPLVVEKYAGKYYVLAYIVDEQDNSHGLVHKGGDWALKRAYPSRDMSTGRPSVQFELDPAGGMRFAQVTSANVDRQLSIFLDGVAMSHATILGQIGARGSITGDFTQERVQELVRFLEAGALPARLRETPLLEKNVGPTLGLRNRQMGMNAAIYGLLAVGLFMLLYYWYVGILADVALALNLLLVLAIMALLEATFTLPGIAGLLLTVGMAVDANVLIFERIREEIERGVVLKRAIKTGYDKALSTIVDANLTTLITCVILGYVGSEEVKGFAMTLGFGIVTSMFTALFVTRVILNTLVDAGMVKSLPMAHIIRRPNVDWLGLRRMFWPISLVIAIGGFSLFLFVSMADREAMYDIEFLGGTGVQIELSDGVTLTAEEVRAAVSGKGGEWPGQDATDWLKEAAGELRNAKVEAENTPGVFTVQADKLAPEEIDVLLHASFESSLAMGGFSRRGDTAVFETKAHITTTESGGTESEQALTLDEFKAGVAGAATYAEQAAARLAGARIQTVSEVGEPVASGSAFEIITVESNKEIVRTAVLRALGDNLKIERPINYTVYTDPNLAPTGSFPIRQDDKFLGDAIGLDAPQSVLEYRGGVAMVFDELDPPQTTADIDQRIKEMKLQPQFQEFESRDYQVFGLNPAGENSKGQMRYNRIALTVRDDSLIYEDDPQRWEEDLATAELEQAKEAFSAEKTLRKVVQFAPSIASQAQHRAAIAMGLALAAIVAYVWIRFGTMQYGLAAIVALVHDVSITLGLMALINWFTPGGLHFRIDMAMIAALLTVVGYSLNDTIVVFDRIRENRGKSGKLTANLINTSINMTLSRTLLTSTTTLVAVVFLFVMGGPGVQSFSFALLVGIIVGTYSSVGIAAPLLRSPKLLYSIIYALVGLGVVGLVQLVGENVVASLIMAAIMATVLGLAANIQRKTGSFDAIPA